MSKPRRRTPQGRSRSRGGPSDAPAQRGPEAGFEAKQARKEQAKLARRRDLRRRGIRRQVRRGLLVGGTLAAIGAVGLLAFRTGSSGIAFAGDFRVGGRIDKLSMPFLEESGRLDYERFRSKPVVLNFFASWCPSCIGEMPGFQEVHEQLGDRVAFLGVSQSDSKGASIDLAKQTHVQYPLGIDASGAFFRAVGGGGMPTTLFIRPGGQIAYIQVGGLDSTALRQTIQQYLRV